MLTNVIAKFGLSKDDTITQFGNGLINDTWFVSSRISDKKFILQRINQKVFKSPELIAFNIKVISEYLNKFHPEYLFASPLENIEGNNLLKMIDAYYRMFSFIPNSHTINIVQKPLQAYEAATQFGKFTKMLSGLDVSQLKITIQDFHNLSVRFKNFEEALNAGNKSRIEQSKELIQFIYKYSSIVEEFENITTDPDFKIRVTHHDTKISNVLFDDNDQGLCVIDLDTIMPGYFMSDVGDMLRTYLSPVSEEEKNFSKIEIRKDFFSAIKDGYLNEMNAELTGTENTHFLYAGKFMIYMQALRFITDHINNDIYYGAKYPDHNFVRAGNQLTLLKKLIEFELTINT